MMLQSSLLRNKESSPVNSVRISPVHYAITSDGDYIFETNPDPSRYHFSRTRAELECLSKMSDERKAESEAKVAERADPFRLCMRLPNSPTVPNVTEEAVERDTGRRKNRTKEADKKPFSASKSTKCKRVRQGVMTLKRSSRLKRGVVSLSMTPQPLNLALEGHDDIRNTADDHCDIAHADNKGNSESYYKGFSKAPEELINFMIKVLEDFMNARKEDRASLREMNMLPIERGLFPCAGNMNVILPRCDQYSDMFFIASGIFAQYSKRVGLRNRSASSPAKCLELSELRVWLHLMVAKQAK